MSKSIHKKYGKDAVPVLQGMLVDNAERNPMPERFQVKQGPRGNCVKIIDTQTGRKSIVSLCHYPGVRQTLNDFFG